MQDVGIPTGEETMKVALGVEPKIEKTTIVKPGQFFWSSSTYEPGPMKTTGHYVRLKIHFTEEEKGIIEQYELYEVTIESSSLYNESEIAQMGEGFRKGLPRSLRATKEADQAVRQYVTEQSKAQMEWKLVHYIDMVEEYATIRAAHERMDYLRDTLLPGIKKLMDRDRTRRSHEEFEL